MLFNRSVSRLFFILKICLPFKFIFQFSAKFIAIFVNLYLSKSDIVRCVDPDLSLTFSDWATKKGAIAPSSTKRWHLSLLPWEWSILNNNIYRWASEKRLTLTINNYLVDSIGQICISGLLFAVRFNICAPCPPITGNERLWEMISIWNAKARAWLFDNLFVQAINVWFVPCN